MSSAEDSDGEDVFHDAKETLQDSADNIGREEEDVESVDHDDDGGDGDDDVQIVEGGIHVKTFDPPINTAELANVEEYTIRGNLVIDDSDVEDDDVQGDHPIDFSEPFVTQPDFHPTSSGSNARVIFGAPLDSDAAVLDDVIIGAGQNSLELVDTKLSKMLSKSADEPDEEEIRRINRYYMYGPLEDGFDLTNITDAEVLSKVMMKNLDTGEYIPLSDAEKLLPKGIDPLSLHLMKRQREFGTDRNADEDDVHDVFLGVSTKHQPGSKFKLFKKNESSHADTPPDPLEKELEALGSLKVNGNHKRSTEFSRVQLLQDMSGYHDGAVWTMKFSHCGRFLATAGQDAIVRVWLVSSGLEFFKQMKSNFAGSEARSEIPVDADEATKPGGTNVFFSKPVCQYRGHTADILDLSWSQNHFLLSSSMDKTVRLWHVARSECLCCFQHADFVTAIAFHPRDDRYFLSGSLDCKIRLWNIPEKKVALWNEVVGPTPDSNLITAANFCQKGKLAVVGTYDGRCLFYDSERLKYHTQVNVRSTRGKNSKGRKISGIEPMPGEDKILITSNDSRVRLYDLKDHTLVCKYRGHANASSQIKASFSYDGNYIVCGSEDHQVHIWNTYLPQTHSRKDQLKEKFSVYRRDRNDSYESFHAHHSVVTVALFAPYSTTAMKGIEGGASGEVLVSADYEGVIKVFVTKGTKEAPPAATSSSS